MLSQDKTGLLKTFLGSLPGPVAARLAQAIETDRLLDGAVLPHEEILTGLRPILRREHQERMPTPLRLFCLPVQDLLSSAPRKAKQKAVIARTSLMPIWHWLGGTLLADETAAYVGEARDLILAHKNDVLLARAAAYWTQAAVALAGALGDDAGRGRAKAVLGDEATLADAEEIALLLGAAGDIAKIQTILPAPVPALGEDLVWQLRDVYDGLVQTNPNVAPYVAVIAMNRLAKPWEALRLPLNITRRNQEAMLAKTDMGLVGEILFQRMEELQAAIMTARHPFFEVEKLLEDVCAFAALSSAVVKEIELKRDGDWGQRIMKDRAAIGKVMDGLMERAPKEIASAMPLSKSNGAKSGDFSRPVDAEKKALALKYARLVIGSRNFAAAASFASKQKDAADEAGSHLRRYIEDVVKELRAAEPERRAIAESQFQFCTELTTLLFSEEEAELLVRRGKAALAA